VRWTAWAKLGVVLGGLGADHKPPARRLLRQAESGEGCAIFSGGQTKPSSMPSIENMTMAVSPLGFLRIS
jgi:hypothetical protein